MLTPVLVTPPAETPVDLAWIKKQLRVDHDDDNEVLTHLIQAATDYLDGWSGVLGRALVTQTWRMDMRAFPYCGFFRIPLLPIQSITSLTYWNASNLTETFAADQYSLFTDSLGSYLRLNANVSWPALYSRSDAARVTFVAGYGAAASVPARIKSAIKLHVEMHYDKADHAATQKAFDALISPLRVQRI